MFSLSEERRRACGLPSCGSLPCQYRHAHAPTSASSVPLASTKRQQVQDASQAHAPLGSPAHVQTPFQLLLGKVGGMVRPEVRVLLAVDAAGPCSADELTERVLELQPIGPRFSFTKL